MDRAIIADASRVSGAQFLDAIFGPYEAKRQETYEQCVRIIQSGGDLYGYPPMLVDHCRKLIAERERFTELKRTGTGGYWS